MYAAEMMRVIAAYGAGGTALGVLTGLLLADDHPHALMSPMLEMVVGGACGLLGGGLFGWWWRRRSARGS